MPKTFSEIITDAWHEMGGHSGHYVLDDNGDNPRAATLGEWLAWCGGRRQRGQLASRVNRTRVGRCDVSTVFISVDINPVPEYCETMIFGGSLDHQQWRIGGKRFHAKRQHEIAVRMAARYEGPWRVWWYDRLARINEFLNDQLYDWRPAQICASAAATL